MLLVLYLGTTAYVWIDSIKHWHDMDKRLKKEGYVSTSNRSYILGDIVILAFSALTLSFPLLNLLIPIINHDKEASYDNYKNYLLEAGAIELKDNDIDLYQDKAIKNKENIIQIDNTKLMERINSKGHTYYSSISKEENNELENGYTYKKILK